MLQFVDEYGDWVELVVLVRFHIGQSISGDREGVLGLATVLDVWGGERVDGDEIRRGVVI